MRTPISAIIGMFFLVSAQTPALAQEQQGPICDKRAELVAALDGRYSEQPSSMGLASTGAVFELLTSEQATWSIIMTTPKGVSCLVATGKFWETLPTELAGVKS
jgi:hypothetical protein